jgi:hypothetical protein
MTSTHPMPPTQGKAEMRPGAQGRARISPGLRTRRIRPARAMRSGAIGLLGLVLILIPLVTLAASPRTQLLAPARVLTGAEAMPAIEPAFVDVDLRNLVLRQAWAPGDSIKMIPKRFYLSEKLVDSQSRAKVPAPGKADPLLALQAGATINKVITPPLLNFAGGGFTGVAPPDTVGDVGLLYYIQSTNSSAGSTFSVYDKETGATVAGPLSMDALGANAPGIVNCAVGRGDPSFSTTTSRVAGFFRNFRMRATSCVSTSAQLRIHFRGAGSRMNSPHLNFPTTPNMESGPMPTTSGPMKGPALGSTPSTASACSPDRPRPCSDSQRAA